MLFPHKNTTTKQFCDIFEEQSLYKRTFPYLERVAGLLYLRVRILYYQMFKSKSFTISKNKTIQILLNYNIVIMHMIMNKYFYYLKFSR